MKVQGEITVYACEPEEEALFKSMSPRYELVPVITGEPLSKNNASLAMGSRCVSVGHKTKVSSSDLYSLRQLGVEFISTRSIGTNHIDLQAAAELGLIVENTCYSPDGVADYTIMLMLMAVRNAKSVLLRVNNHDYTLNDKRGKELCDMTVGVIGTGRIGKEVVQRLRGFGGHILAYDSRPELAAEYAPLDDLLERSDIVTLHTPLNSDTYHFLGNKQIEKMKPGAIVVNTGRGGLIDTEALVLALENGKLGGAALDVIEGEEGSFYYDRSGGSVENTYLLRLHALSNVTIMPHMAYHTAGALRDTVEKTLESFVLYEREREKCIS